MGFSRQEYWSQLPFPSPGDLPHLGIKPMSPELAGILYHWDSREALSMGRELKYLTSWNTICQCNRCQDPGSIPGLGRSPKEGNGNLLQYSCLENPMDKEAWRATVQGITKSWTALTNWTYTTAENRLQTNFRATAVSQRHNLITWRTLFFLFSMNVYNKTHQQR